MYEKAKTVHFAECKLYVDFKKVTHRVYCYRIDQVLGFFKTHNCVIKYVTKWFDILQMISENCYFCTHNFMGQTRIINVWKVP